MKNKLIHYTQLTCPFCGFREVLEIPADFCLISHRCTSLTCPSSQQLVTAVSSALLEIPF